MIVQRYLCARDQRSASWALGLSGFVVLLQFGLFLLIGIALACFYARQGVAPAKGDEVFMTFVVDHMGIGFRGLILAAVLAATMSNLSASFNSSASSLMSDWLNRWVPKVDDRSALRMARLLTCASAVVHAAVAIAVYEIGLRKAIVDTVLGIAGFAIGLLLGLYALGLISRRVSQGTALTAFLVGVIVTCAVAFGTAINSYWYTLVGSTTIVTVGLVLSFFFDAPVGASERKR
jgi:SSS family solute:Na+ symporter